MAPIEKISMQSHAFDRIIVIIFENQYRGNVMANPYMRALANRGSSCRITSASCIHRTPIITRSCGSSSTPSSAAGPTFSNRSASSMAGTVAHADRAHAPLPRSL
jgi:hypothetical protein